MTESTDEVKIYEFSTGIRHQETVDGGWVSLGFTGQYMNATIDPIPYAVQRSIANKEFAVTEGASSDQPAVIGRVVLGRNGELDQSVVAIVTRGRDEKGRSTSLYRYFLCEGKGSLPKILAWIEDYGQMPVFNPSETKVVRQPNISTVTSSQFQDLTPETQSWLESETAPLLIPAAQEYTLKNLQKINKLATEKAETNGQPIAWAFNVEALEQLRGFQIIQAASARAYDLLEKAKINTPQFLLAPVVADEQAIKSAIKGLINSNTIQLKYIEAIANDLGHPQIPGSDWRSYWRNIFDGQGADKALKQGIYSPQMVRLLMLRAIVIPQTLPECLVWLEKGNKQNDLYKVAAEFESQLSNSFSIISDKQINIEIKVIEGLQILLPSLLKQKVSPEAVNKLLTSDNGLWRKLSRQFIENIEHDLNLMQQFSYGQRNLPFKLTDTEWQRIRQELQSYWCKREYIHLEKYQIFAELFFNLNRPKLSAFFCHVGYGQVPKKIFAQLQSNGWNTQIYGVVVQREVTVPESLWLTIIKIGSKIVPVAIVIPMVLLSLFLGFGLRGYIPTNSYKAEQDVPSGENNNHNSNISSENSGKAASQNNEISPKKSLFLQKIDDESREAILKISNELSHASQNKQTPEDVQSKIFDILKIKDSFKSAIEQYQKSKISKTNPSIDQAAGVITYKQTTSNVLECEVAKSLSINLQDVYKYCESTSKN